MCISGCKLRLYEEVRLLKARKGNKGRNMKKYNLTSRCGVRCHEVVSRRHDVVSRRRNVVSRRHDVVMPRNTCPHVVMFEP